LVHYNPAAPNHLLFWIASEEPAAYEAMAAVAQVMDTTTGLDSLILRNSDRALVMGRSFDSRWQWLPREATPLLPKEVTTTRALNGWVADSVRRAAGADFAVSADVGFELKARRWPSDEIAQVPGITRVSDILGLLYYEPIGVMSLTGAELIAAEEGLSKAGGATFEPALEPARLRPKRSYTVALTSDQIWPFGRSTRLRPTSFRQTELTASAAVLQFTDPSQRTRPRVGSRQPN
jgi:hypothetical protein